MQRLAMLSFLLLTTQSIAAPQVAHALSPRGRSTLRNVKIALRGARKNLRLFDGKRILPGASINSVGIYKRTLFSNLNRATRYWNRLSPADRGTPEASKVGSRLFDLLAYAKALDRALKNARKAAAGADKTCRDFEKEAMGAVDRQAMLGLVWLLQDPGKVTYGNVNLVKKAVAAAKKIKSFCARPKYRNVGKTGCDWMKVRNRDRDPSAWCEAAAKYKSLVKRGVLNFVKQQGRISGGRDPKPRELKRQNGWLPWEGKVTYKSHLYFTEEAKKRLLAKLGPMFAAAEMTNVNNPSIWKRQTEKKAALRAKVDELAPTWGRYPTRGCNYGCRMAKRIIKRWHRKARITKVGLRDKTWHIRKSAIGIPVERTRQGVIIFRIPGEKWCQARSFVLTEPYRGHGRYRRARSVRIGYVRFQKRCK